MLQLKSLEVQGFKSFPDKTKIDFSRGITAIVGPNGSGKSNIADAIRWVMGETSSKNLRGAKMEDVIFDGTKTRKQLGFAQVSLILDNTDGELPVAFSEVCLTRRYYRSGESEYAVNGKPARLRDIQELLRDTGLGKDGYSIIGQGSITEIINAKSADRRYLFEEAAGIAKYKVKKEESRKKLTLTQENILRLGDILAELRERLPVLESQAGKAKKYLAFREEKKVLDIGLWLHAAGEWAETLKKAEAAAEALENDRRQAEKDLVLLEEAAEKNEAERQTLTVEIEQSRGDVRRVEGLIQEKKAQILLLQNDAEHTAADIRRLEEEARAQETEKQALLLEKETLLSRISEAEEQARLAEKEKEKIQRQKAEKAENAVAFYRRAEAFRQELSEKEQSLSRVVTAQAVLEQERTQISSRRQTLSEELAAAAEREKNLQVSLRQASSVLTEQEQQLQENRNVIKGREMKYSLQKAKKESLFQQLQTLSSRLSETENRRRLLEDMEKSHEGFSGSVHRVLADSSRGILKGIHGTVASLITVKKEFAVAIETALGAGIQNLVTETEGDAKNAIFHLKNQRAGRATFLPVQTIRGRRLEESRIQKDEGYLGVAADLIGYDSKYEGIFSFLLGKTVIADRLDSAAVIAKKNGYAFRVVTTDGQVINAGGSLTGGSVAKNVGILSRKNEIESLSGQAKDLREQVETVSSSLREAEEEQARLKALADGVRDEILGLEKQIISSRSETEHLSSYLANLSEQRQGMETEEKTLSGRENQIVASLQEGECSATSLREEIAGINRNLEALGAENESLQQEESRLAAAIQEQEIQALSFRNLAESLRQSVETAGEMIRRGEEKNAGNLSEQQQRRLALQGFAERQNQLQAEISEAETYLSQAGDQIGRKRTERELLEKEHAALYEKEKEIYSLKEKLARESEKNRSGMENAAESLKTMEIRLWDEYEVTVSEARRDFTVPENISRAKERANALKNSIKALGTVSLESIDEFVSVKERFEELDRQTGDLVRSKEELEKIIASLETEMTKVFREKFGQISREFEKVFRDLFGGGEARLSLTDGENVLESGIDIFVAPPGKVIKNMSLLSGGEQALTSICLYFAILNIHPAPFCLLDEIEAALDDANVVRYAEYLRRLTGNTQLITITHRRGTMEIADRLYGVAMREKGISKILTINVAEIEKNLQPEGL